MRTVCQERATGGQTGRDSPPARADLYVAGREGRARRPPAVVALHIANGSRLPTRRVDAVVAEAGKGLVGDRCR